MRRTALAPISVGASPEVKLDWAIKAIQDLTRASHIADDIVRGDLFLAAGAKIDWGSGDAIIQHSSDALAFTGAANGYSFDAPLTVQSVVAFRANSVLFNSFFAGAGNATATGTDNHGEGRLTLGALTSGDENCGWGSVVLRNLTTGNSNAAFANDALNALTTGSYCAAFGWSAGLVATTAEYLAAFGNQSLYRVTTGGSNSGFGAFAGETITTGVNGLFLGRKADALSAALNNAVAIGAYATVGSSNTMVLGALSTSTPGALMRVLTGVDTFDGYGGNFDIRSPFTARAANDPTQLFVADNATSQAADKGGAIDFGGYSSVFARAYSWARIEGLATASSGHGGYLKLMVLNAGGAMVEGARIDQAKTLILGGGLTSSVQDLNGAGALDLTTLTTKWGTTAADAGTLADGSEGQIKIITMDADGGDGTLTPANFGNGTTITFNDVGDSVTLQFLGTDWWLLSNNGCTIA